MTLLTALEYASVFVFALTGALTASRAQLDLIGFIFIGALTAVGGGTLRDVILDREMVFWVANPAFILVAAVAAITVFFTAHLLESRYRGIVWLDALALAVAVPSGVGIALEAGMSWPVVIIMGITTGCFGGLMRDVVCNEVPLVLRQGELYVTCALSGGIATLFALLLGADTAAALIWCAAAVLVLRFGSLLMGWRLPVYKGFPPRQP